MNPQNLPDSEDIDAFLKKVEDVERQLTGLQDGTLAPQDVAVPGAWTFDAANAAGARAAASESAPAAARPAHEAPSTHQRPSSGIRMMSGHPTRTRLSTCTARPSPSPARRARRAEPSARASASPSPPPRAPPRS